MKDNFELQNLGNNDVLGCNNILFKAGKFRQAFKEAKNRAIEQIGYALSSYGMSKQSEVFKEGVDIEFLKVGAKDWRKGRLRIKVIVELCPDEPGTNQPESPLDDLRQMIHKE